MLIEFYKLALQLVVLGVLGGAVTWFYSRQQRRREMRNALLREFADTHGQFIALRFRYNSSQVTWGRDPEHGTHPLNAEELRLERWDCFSEACSLLGKFQAQKPLLTAYFFGVDDRLHALHQGYQEWRRRTALGRPILQEVEGRNEEKYETLKEDYQRLIAQMKLQL